MGLAPGEVVFWMARPGNFKTAVLSNILQRGSVLSKKPALFFSMEMGVTALTVRHVQQAEGLSKKEALEIVRERKQLEKTREMFKDVHVVGLSRLSTDRMLGLIDFYMETYGELSAIGVDYLSLFDGCANNTERTARQATELKTVIGKAANCPVLCLVQAKREYEGREGDIELDRGAGKDSSSIEDTADYLIGSWGKWHNLPTGEEKIIYGRFLKSRGMDSDLYKINPYFGLNLDKRTMTLKDIAYIENPPAFNTRKGDNE
jgi:replicative DNA helicase